MATLLRTIFEQPTPTPSRPRCGPSSMPWMPSSPKLQPTWTPPRATSLALTAFPREIWRPIWSNNPQERPKKEILHRTDVVGMLFPPCLARPSAPPPFPSPPSRASALLFLALTQACPDR
ncbi:transposase [Streptomyces sp. NPDC059690]|uniref:transposase n=1 Tax=Streptomyces sp. NPDC059690 TaxID=3346907 RepID=UPI0036D18715